MERNGLIFQVELDELTAAGIEVEQFQEFLELNSISSVDELEQTLLLLINMNEELYGMRPS